MLPIEIAELRASTVTTEMQFLRAGNTVRSLYTDPNNAIMDTPHCRARSISSAGRRVARGKKFNIIIRCNRGSPYAFVASVRAKLQHRLGYSNASRLLAGQASLTCQPIALEHDNKEPYVVSLLVL